MDAAIAVAPEAFVLDLLYASLRPGAALALLPALGGQMIPVRVRIGLAGAIGWLILSLPSAPERPGDLLSVAGFAAIGGELLIGMVAALMLHAAFAAAMLAGDWLAQAMGLGFATTVQGDAAPSASLSALLALLLWALFLTSGGHLLLIRLLVESHATLPSAGPLFAPDRLLAVVRWGGLALASGALAALPLGAAMLLVNLALGVTTRSAPQLNLFSVGFPLMLLAGLAGLPLALPGMADRFQLLMAELQDSLAAVLLG